MPTVLYNQRDISEQWRIKRGLRGRSKPALCSRFKISYENEIIETKLFHFHGIFKKNEINQQSEPRPNYFIFMGYLRKMR